MHHSLRRRFQQNQEDCTFTVLALLPTATENVLDALPVESITNELQHQRAEKIGRSVGTSELAPSEPSSGERSGAGEDVKSQTSVQSGEYLHASQMAASNLTSDEPFKPKKSKAQLWDELKINCEWHKSAATFSSISNGPQLSLGPLPSYIPCHFLPYLRAYN